MSTARTHRYSRDPRIVDADVSDLVGTDALAAAELDPAVRCQEKATDLIEDLLLCLDSPVTDRNVRAVEQYLSDLATVRAAETLRHWLLVLDHNAEAVALRRVVLGDCGEPLREAAKHARVSHVALWKAEGRIRAKLGLQPAATVEADGRPEQRQ